MCQTEFSQLGYLRLDSNLGFAKAVNAGINQIQTEFVALLNNDTQADPDWVKSGLEAFDRYPEYWFFASRMVNFFQRQYLDSAGDCYGKSGLPIKRGFGRVLGTYPNPEPVLGASAGAAFYRRILFEKIGLFDEEFRMYLEDVDFSLRAQLHGYGCCYLPDAVVYHMEAASDVDRSPDNSPTGLVPYYSKNRVFWITRNRWLLMITYQPFRNFPWLVYGWFKSFLFHLVKAGFTFSFLKGIIAGTAWSLYAGRKRLKLRRSKTLSHRELCQLMNQC